MYSTTDGYDNPKLTLCGVEDEVSRPVLGKVAHLVLHGLCKDLLFSHRSWVA
jgi:hypothetical protein